jgi:transposase
MAIVGDRGMISQASIEQLREEHFSWIMALKSKQIHTLVVDGELQLSLFDERSLFELTHPDFPDERLVACRNPELAKLRAHKRESLIAATQVELEKVRDMVTRGRLSGAAEIGVRVGRVLNKYKVGKHFELNITDQSFDFSLRENKIADEAALDGVYVIRTDVAKRKMSAEDTVRNYKSLSTVERAFRSIKTIDLKVRPIHHRRENRVRVAHARGVGRIAVCRRGSRRQGHARSGCPRSTFGSGAEEGANAPARRRHTGAQLPHVA